MDEILVNTSIVGDQQGSTIAGFRGTQFVAVWEDNGDGTIKGQMFGANGSKSSSEFVVNLPGSKHEPEAAGDRGVRPGLRRRLDRKASRRRCAGEASDLQ